MGAGACVEDICKQVGEASPDDLKSAVASLSEEDHKKLTEALNATPAEEKPTEEAKKEEGEPKKAEAADKKREEPKKKAPDRAKIHFSCAFSVDFVGLDGSRIATWTGPGTANVVAVKSWVAENQGISVLQVRLVRGEEELSGDFEPIQKLLGDCSTVTLMKLAAVPATYECSTCSWQLTGFTCAKCEQLLLGNEDGGASCSQCEGGMKAPTCCQNAMRLLTKTEKRGSLPAYVTLPAAERRKQVDRDLCPAFSCSGCSFAVTGVRCLTCGSCVGAEMKRSAFHERVAHAYVWVCPNWCCQSKDGGKIVDGTMVCARCADSALQCSEYYKAFGSPTG